ncbi:MAG TPA: ice-binding family protein [Acidimicrobiales bacterium]|nr:ice-binding family protein [Acidimicrobiales bacterium]
MTQLSRRLAATLAALALSWVVVAPGAEAEAVRPDLDEAGSYAVVADSSIASTGATVVTGDVAIAASSTLTGFPPGTITGATHLADAEAIAVAGRVTEINQNLQSQPCNSDRTGEDLGGLRLGGAVYCYIETTTLTGELRLDALGDIDTVWVFQVNGNLDVGAGSRVIPVNGAQSCNVFWQVDGVIDIGAGSSIAGTFLSETGIVLRDGVTLDGRLFSAQGGVDLARSTIGQSGCLEASATTTTTDPASTSTTVDPATGTTIDPTTDAGSGSGSGSGSGTGDGTSGTGGSSDEDGLAFTGPVSMAVVLGAIASLGVGHALLGTERVAAWNARRWRPRHAQPRLARLRRR